MKNIALANFAIHCFGAIAFYFITALVPNLASADDIESFVPTLSCGVNPDYRFIFVVDNSGSMSNLEFDQSKITIDAAIEKVLNSMPEAKVAIVQFGSSNTATHHYHITIPFTDDKVTATSWQRAYGANGVVNAAYIQDHVPAILSKMRLDNVYAPGGALDITNASNVQFIMFSDADRDIAGACCSSLVAEDYSNISSDVLPMFGEYDALKNGNVLPGGLEAQFTLLHVSYSVASKVAGAAIATVGGDYVGNVEANLTDPDGSGVVPRRYIDGTFSASDTTNILDMIDQVIQETYIPPDVDSESFSEVSVDVSTASGWSTGTRVFISLFKPSINRAWQGNIKGYFIGENGLEDTNGNDAVVSTTDGTAFAASAQSFWSALPDGNTTIEGGASEQINASRTLVTNVGSSSNLMMPENLLSSSNVNVTTTLLGAGSDAERLNALNWLQNAPMGDPLHSKPTIVRYPTKSIVFGMTNQGLLHAIDATSPTAVGIHTGGAEIWAFMPKELLKNLPLLSSTSTPGDHVYGLDGTMARWHDDQNGDQIVNGSDSVTLIIGMRRGGRNYYALDVTNPYTPILKWQITGGVTPGFEDLQQTWSRTVLTTLRHGSKKKVLIFGGGYDLAEDSKTFRSDGSGNRVYIVEADTGTLLWSVGAGSMHKNASDMRYSIPSDILAIDVNGNDHTDNLYFGDMGGQLWRITFKENVDANNVPTSNFDILPTATRIGNFGSSSHIQFFYPPTAAIMMRNGEEHLTVTIGSGNRAHPIDRTVQDWIFMIRDSIETPITTAITFSNLYDATQNLIVEGSDTTAEKAALAAAAGWKLKLNSGEKSLSSPTVFDEKLRFTTFEAAEIVIPEACGVTPKTTSRYYVLNLLDATPTTDSSTIDTGLTKADRSTEIEHMGIPSAPVFVFPPDGSEVQVYVNREAVGQVPERVKRIFWKKIK